MTHVRLIDQGDYLCQTSTHPPQHIVTRLEVVGESSQSINTFQKFHSSNVSPKKYYPSVASLSSVYFLSEQTEPELSSELVLILSDVPGLVWNNIYFVYISMCIVGVLCTQ